jgi:DNA-binding transcriptional LysR family regulator
MAHSDPFHQETGLDIDDLILFWHIIQQGHFGRAGRVLGFSQPKVSRKVWKLEKYFGTTLMLRGTKGVVLTNTGKLVLEMARGVIEKVHAVKALSNDNKHEMQGEISIICTPGFALFWLADVMQSFWARYPEVRLRSVTSDLEDGDLLLGEADIIISSLAPKDLEGVQIRTLCEYPLYLYASKEYLEQRGMPRSMADLAEHDTVTVINPLETPVHPLVGPALIGPKGKIPRGQGSGDIAVMATLLAGGGIEFFPSIFGERLGLQKIGIFSPEGVKSPVQHTKYVSWHESVCETERHKAFLEALRGHAESTAEFSRVWETFDPGAAPQKEEGL